VVCTFLRISPPRGVLALAINPILDLNAMALSPRGMQGVSLLLILSRHGGPCSVSELVGATGLSLVRTEELLRDLRRGGLVQSRVGRSGGFLLARPLAEMTLADVIAALPAAAKRDMSFIDWASGSTTGRHHAGSLCRAVETAFAQIRLSEL
jgi:Rrf2 family protein